MKDILKAISAHQKAMGVDPATMTMEATMVYLRELVLATHVELAEMLEHLPWKPWKPLHVQTADMDEAIKELADVFIFLGNIVNLLGANHDIKACILHKVMEVNFTRLKEGEHVSRGEKGEETYVKSEAYKKHLSERREKGRERKEREKAAGPKYTYYHKLQTFTERLMNKD